MHSSNLSLKTHLINVLDRFNMQIVTNYNHKLSPMKSNILLIAVLLICFGSHSVKAQTTSTVLEDVILFNSEPYKVRMTPKGKILAFISDVDNSYSALNTVSSSTVQVEQDEIEKAIDLARANGNSLNQEELAATLDARAKSNASKYAMNKPASAEVDGAMAVADVESPDEMMPKGKVAEDSGVTTTITDYDYEFAFDHRDATLSPSSVNQLTEIAKLLNKDTDKTLKINSYFSETVDVSKILSKNRAEGIQDMLVSKGIDKSRISITESNNKDWANNRVKVSIH